MTDNKDNKDLKKDIKAIQDKDKIQQEQKKISLSSLQSHIILFESYLNFSFD